MGNKPRLVCLFPNSGHVTFSRSLPDFAYLYFKKIVCVDMDINKKRLSRVIPVVCNDEISRPSILLDLFASKKLSPWTWLLHLTTLVRCLTNNRK